MDSKDLLARVIDDGVKFISLQFTDVTGVVKSVDMPAQRLESALEDGVWFDGSSVELHASRRATCAWCSTPHCAVLPGRHSRDGARIFCDIYAPICALRRRPQLAQTDSRRLESTAGL
jgi:glutamine synthetase